jgi:hypothetical protein
VKRADLLSTLKSNLEGLVHLSMSEPMRNHEFKRLAWVNFSSEHDCVQALEKIPNLTVGDENNGFPLSAARSLPNKKKTPVRITPPLPSMMIEHDYDLCKRLIAEVFDPEKEIETYIVKQVDEQSEISAQNKLDILLLYLRRVHAFCLYCGEEYEDERMLSTRCGP